MRIGAQRDIAVVAHFYGCIGPFFSDQHITLFHRGIDAQRPDAAIRLLRQQGAAEMGDRSGRNSPPGRGYRRQKDHQGQYQLNCNSSSWVCWDHLQRLHLVNLML